MNDMVLVDGHQKERDLYMYIYAIDWFFFVCQEGVSEDPDDRWKCIVANGSRSARSVTSSVHFFFLNWTVIIIINQLIIINQSNLPISTWKKQHFDF